MISLNNKKFAAHLMAVVRDVIIKRAFRCSTQFYLLRDITEWQKCVKIVANQMFRLIAAHYMRPC